MHISIGEFIIDGVQNSLEAGADKVTLVLEETPAEFHVRIEDNGKGMTRDELDRVRDPFFTDGKKHRQRRVGLGIPFLSQALEQTGRFLDISSKPGVGTILDFRFPLDNVDTPPVGDLIGIYMQLINFGGNYECDVLRSRTDTVGSSDSYRFSRKELQDVLGDLSDIGSLSLAKEFFASQENELIGGNHG